MHNNTKALREWFVNMIDNLPHKNAQDIEENKRENKSKVNQILQHLVKKEGKLVAVTESGFYRTPFLLVVSYQPILI